MNVLLEKEVKIYSLSFVSFGNITSKVPQFLSLVKLTPHEILNDLFKYVRTEKYMYFINYNLQHDIIRDDVISGGWCGISMSPICFDRSEKLNVGPHSDDSEIVRIILRETFKENV